MQLAVLRRGRAELRMPDWTRSLTCATVTSREQLLYASKTDAEDLARQVLPQVGDDVNKKDGLGMTGVLEAVSLF